MNILKQFKFPEIFTIAILLVIAYSIFVRAQGLGYSNFQGDEVNPMDFMYEMKEGVLSYLLSQKRGPMQYLINMANVAIFGYQDEGLIRFPYFIFGVTAIYLMYRLSKRIFDSGTALIVALLMSVNGLFIAFARITQYQAFMYFLVPIGVYLFLSALKELSYKKFLYAGLIMSLSVLAHYDTLSVLPFFIIAFIGFYFRSYKEKVHKNLFKKILKYSLVFFLAFFIPALCYYVPFYLGSAFNSTTSGYLENRLFGGGFMPRTAITLKLLTMYIPKFHIYLLFLFGFIGILMQSLNIGSIHIKFIKISEKFLQYVFITLLVIMPADAIFSLYPIKPRASTLLMIGSSFVIIFLLTFSKKVPYIFAALSAWFLGAFSFYFFIMKDPRTHVYVVFIPLFILAGYGFTELYKKLKPIWLKSTYITSMFLMVIFVSGFNWVVFVDKSPEYPWWDKDFLGWPIYRIERVRHKKIEGVFGFNNYRGWEQIADLYKKGCLVGTFNSNEKNSITYFYTRFDQKQMNEWGMQLDADNLILVEGPHSWEYFSPSSIPNSYRLLHNIESEGYVVSRVYGLLSLYPKGKMLCE